MRFHSREATRVIRFTETESRTGGVRGRGDDEELVFSADRASVREGEKVLEMTVAMVAQPCECA